MSEVPLYSRVNPEHTPLNPDSALFMQLKALPFVNALHHYPDKPWTLNPEEP
jgi:hypothetical protein